MSDSEDVERAANADEPPAPIDPAIRPLLAQLAALRVPTDADPAPAALAALEQLEESVDAVARVVGGRGSEARLAEQLADVARLRDAALGGPEVLGALRAKIAEARRALGGGEPIRSVATLGERLLARLERPPLVHVLTGLGTLDAATRGGLLLRRVHVIGGEPDAGKTALLVQLLLEAARHGYAVAIYAVDEPGEGIEDRIGQSLGLALDDLERNVQRAILWLADEVRDLPNVLLIEQGEHGFATIEDAADALLAHARRHGCRGAVIGIDSLQTAACRAFFGPNPPRLDRERLDAMTVALKALAKRGLGVLATSELGRASYDQKPGRKPVSPMAAFKGSGSIEYTMTVGMLLSRIPRGEHAGDVRLALPKNKRGDPAYRGVNVRLERDPDRCTFTDRGRLDAGEDAPAQAGEGEAKPASVSDKLLERVRHVLRTHPHGIAGGAEGLAELVGGKRPATRRAIKALEAGGEIERKGGKIFHRDQLALPVPDPRPQDPTAEAVRAHVLNFLAVEEAAGRVVPSSNAVVQGLREQGQGARPAAVRDAVDVLFAGGQVSRSRTGVLALTSPVV